MNRRYQMALLIGLCAAAVVNAEDPQPISREIPGDVEVQRNLSYATYGDRQLLLDLYRPAAMNDTTLPVIVVIRGGGWRQGDKDGFGPLSAALAKRGFAAACIEYRPSGEALFPAAVEDTKAAVRWIRANADKYHLDPDAIGAIGGSAGAHLALYLGVTSNEPSLEGKGGNAGHSSEISAVVAMATPGDLTRRPDAPSHIAFMGVQLEEASELWKKASPSNHIRPSSPPVLLIHSTTDSVVPFDLSTQMLDKFDEVGVAAELIPLRDAPHAFWNYVEWFDSTLDSAAAFFDRELR